MAVKGRLRFEILRRDQHTCRYCGRKAPEVPLTVDHVVPVALGGTDDPTNLVTACKPCNDGKASIQPDAPFVAQARDDAMRWQVAWATAVAEAVHDGAQRAKDIAKVKKNYVSAYRGRHGENPILPEGWESSVGRWLDLGLPLTLIDKAIASSIGREYIRADKRWNYFAGCCWSLLRELGDRTRQIADVPEAAAEPWEQKVERAVLDTAMLVWRTYYMQAVGSDPDEGFEAEAREYASDIYPGEVSPAQLITAAQMAGEAETTAVSDYMNTEDFEPAEEEFEVRIARAYALGWAAADDNPRPENFAVAQFQPILAQALMAHMAAYEIDSIRYAAYEAARTGTQDLLAQLPTLEKTIREYGPYAPDQAARYSPSQSDLDAYLVEARADIERSRQARARHAAECAGCGWCTDRAPEGGSY